MAEENPSVTILVPSLAIIFYGLLQIILFPSKPVNFDSLLLIESVISGASMFGAYYATMKLYALTDIASAEFPTLISSLVIQPLELFILAAPLKAPYFLASVAFIACIFVIMKLQTHERELNHA